MLYNFYIEVFLKNLGKWNLNAKINFKYLKLSDVQTKKAFLFPFLFM